MAISKTLVILVVVLSLFVEIAIQQASQAPNYKMETVAGYKGVYPTPMLAQPATDTQFPYITGLHVLKSPLGNYDDVYFSDYDSIYKVDASTGLLSLLASKVATRIHKIHVVPKLDTVFFFEENELVIKKVNYRTNQVTLVAGIAKSYAETPDQLATNTSLGYYVDDMYYTEQGELYFVNGFFTKIKKVTANGYIQTIVGNSYIPQNEQEHKDAFNLPQNATGKLADLGVVSSMYVTKGLYGEELIYLGSAGLIHLVNMTSGIKTIIAGSITQASSYSIVDGTVAKGSSIGGGSGVRSMVVENNSLDAANKVYYYGDVNNGAIRKVVNGKIYAHVSGTQVGATTFANQTRADVEFISISSTNEIYYTDAYYKTIRKVNKNGVVTTIAGSYGDNIDAKRVKIHPQDVTTNSKNNLIFLDESSNKILLISNTTNRLETLQFGYSVPNGVGEITTLHYSKYDDTIMFASKTQIFKLLNNGTRIVLAGNGKCTYGLSTSDTIALNTPICGLYSIFQLSDGSVLVPLYGDNQIKKVLPNGNLITIVGNTALPIQLTPDGLTGSETVVNGPLSVSQLSNGEIVFVEQLFPRVRKIKLDGTIVTIMGNGTKGSNNAENGKDYLLNNPYGLFITKNDIIYVSDMGNNRIVKMDTTGKLTIVVNSTITTPAFITVNSRNELFVSDSSNEMIRKLTPSCNPGYTYSQESDLCVTLSCFGKSSKESGVCSSHGSCIEVDTCKCDVGYSGKDCSSIAVPSQVMPTPSRAESKRLSSSSTLNHSIALFMLIACLLLIQ